MKFNNQSQATFVSPTGFRISKDGRYLIISLPGNQLIRKPLNYFRAILANSESAQKSDASL